jgi:hypothetical protein
MRAASELTSHGASLLLAQRPARAGRIDEKDRGRVASRQRHRRAWPGGRRLHRLPCPAWPGPARAGGAGKPGDAARPLPLATSPARKPAAAVGDRLAGCRAQPLRSAIAARIVRHAKHEDQLLQEAREGSGAAARRDRYTRRRWRAGRSPSAGSLVRSIRWRNEPHTAPMRAPVRPSGSWRASVISKSGGASPDSIRLA